MHHEARNGEFLISTDPARQDVAAVHAYLTQSYWAEGISQALVARSIAGSLCFGVFHHEQQIGFARVITDKATFAYLADVYILEPFRGNGLARWLMSFIMNHPDLQGLRRFLLITRDAAGLYRPFGFQSVTHPDRFLEIFRPGLYRQNSHDDAQV